MMFDKRTKNAICYGWKFVTRRLFKGPIRPAVPTAESGKLHKIKIDRSKKVYGELEIIDCYTSTLGLMTEKDAHLEGFDSLQEYKEYFYSKNGFIDDDETIWVIEFRPVWCTSLGVVL